MDIHFRSSIDNVFTLLVVSNCNCTMCSHYRLTGPHHLFPGYPSGFTTTVSTTPDRTPFCRSSRILMYLHIKKPTKQKIVPLTFPLQLFAIGKQTTFTYKIGKVDIAFTDFIPKDPNHQLILANSKMGLQNQIIHGANMQNLRNMFF